MLKIEHIKEGAKITMLRSLLTAILSGTMFSAGALAVQAADLSAPPALVAPGIVETQSPWMLRGRALVVKPQADANLSIAGAPVVGGDVNISTSLVPELDITYFITPNIAAELILGVTPHRVKGSGSLAGTRIGDVWLLPPTVMLQYHFTGLGMFKPYVGAGINYTVFFNEKAKGDFQSFNLDNNVGFALQAGIDIMIDKNWGINFDVKKLFLEADASVNNGLVTGKVRIDPWLIGTGVTYRF